MRVIHRIGFVLGSVALGVLVVLSAKPKDLTYRGQFKDRFAEKPDVMRKQP